MTLAVLSSGRAIPFYSTVHRRDGGGTTVHGRGPAAHAGLPQDPTGPREHRSHLDRRHGLWGVHDRGTSQPAANAAMRSRPSTRCSSSHSTQRRSER